MKLLNVSDFVDIIGVVAACTGQATVRPAKHNITYTSTCMPPPHQQYQQN